RQILDVLPQEFRIGRIYPAVHISLSALAVGLDARNLRLRQRPFPIVAEILNVEDSTPLYTFHRNDEEGATSSVSARDAHLVQAINFVLLQDANIRPRPVND